MGCVNENIFDVIVGICKYHDKANTVIVVLIFENLVQNANAMVIDIVRKNELVKK